MTTRERYEITDRLCRLGFTYEESQQVRRISMTLRRWYERECGDSDHYASWSIERNEETNKPYFVQRPHKNNTVWRRPIADKETGAKKRLATLLQGKDLTPYYQTDPRGCALYLLRPGDVPEGQAADCYYNRGIAIY